MRIESGGAQGYIRGTSLSGEALLPYRLYGLSIKSTSMQVDIASGAWPHLLGGESVDCGAQGSSGEVLSCRQQSLAAVENEINQFTCRLSSHTDDHPVDVNVDCKVLHQVCSTTTMWLSLMKISANAYCE